MTVSLKEQRRVLSRYWHWALDNAAFEATNGFPMLGRVKGTSSMSYLVYMLRCPAVVQVDKALAMVRNSHSSLLGELPTKADNIESENYREFYIITKKWGVMVDIARSPDFERPGK